MLIYAGIDEAGYGPMLGPLTLGCTAFRIDDHQQGDGAPNLWKLLSKAVCKSRGDRSRRIAIDDSKKIKGANDGAVHPLRHLERGVLGFCGARGPDLPADAPPDFPRDDAALLEVLGIAQPPARWYDSYTSLPVGQTREELCIAAAVLQRAMQRAGVACELIAAEAIDAATFNEQVEKMGSKAAVNFCSVMRLVDKVWKRWPNDHPRIIVDRQGGRSRYLRTLQLCYPDAMIRVICEEETVSRYELNDGGRQMTISFIVEADGGHFPVALASMTAKYIRELLMLRLNRFFCTQMPELKATAGYFGDGRRYLADIEPLINKLGLRRSDLVRAV